MKKFNNFITFEGPEGSGKSTIAKMIQEKLISLGYNVILTREPGGKEIKFSEDIRKIIMNYKDINIMTELLLFQSSRKEHIEKLIKPSLKKGDIVICDRYIDSSTVYQGMVQNLGKEKVVSLNNLTVDDLIPSLTIILDVDPEIGINRTNNENRVNNRFDEKDLAFHKKVQESYMELSKSEKRFYTVDANRDLENVYDDVLKKVIEVIND